MARVIRYLGKYVVLTTNTSTIDYNCISTFEILKFYDTTIKTKSR